MAVIGTAEGGRPVSTIEEPKDFIRLGEPERVRQAFRSGDLREAGGMLFEPAKDPDITAGAQEIVAMKVNPATQSAATLANAQGEALTVTSRDYGAFTGQINVSVASGTSKGKLISIVFEDIVEGVDDLGGEDIFQLTYAGGANGWGTMSALVGPGGNIEANGTRAIAGLDSGVGTQLGSNTEIEVASDNPADGGNQVTVWCLDGAGDPVREVLALNGTSVVVGTQVFSVLLGAEAAGTAGNTTVRPSGGGAAVFTVTAGSSAGLYVGEQMYVGNGPVTIVADGPSTAQVVVAGTNAAGSLILEKLTLDGTTPVVGVGSFTTITRILMAAVAASPTVTLSAQAARSTSSVQNTIKKVADHFNARQQILPGPVTRGFTFTLVTPLTSLRPANLDVSVTPAKLPQSTEVYLTTMAFTDGLGRSSLTMVETEDPQGYVASGW